VVEKSGLGEDLLELVSEMKSLEVPGLQVQQLTLDLEAESILL
jgi:hypothetical protein